MDPDRKNQPHHCWWCGCIIAGEPFIGADENPYCSEEHKKKGESASISFLSQLKTSQKGYPKTLDNPELATGQREKMVDYLKSALQPCSSAQIIDFDQLKYPALVFLFYSIADYFNDECTLPGYAAASRCSPRTSPEEIDKLTGWAVKVEKEG